MQDSTVRTLLDLNAQFYQTFALQFSATRQRLQPGVRRLLDELPRQLSLLDLGCGNGELAAALIQGGHAGRYVGLDFSPGLLAAAEAAVAQARAETGGAPTLDVALLPANLAETGWEQVVPAPPYELIVGFAVLHHLPGAALRRSVVAAASRLLAPGGRLVFSAWQFLNSPRLTRRIQPWEAAGLRAEDVEPGDYLLDWRAGGAGLRYVHHFSEEELSELAAQAGRTVRASFYSDGEGGRLSIYQIWQ